MPMRAVDYAPAWESEMRRLQLANIRLSGFAETTVMAAKPLATVLGLAIADAASAAVLRRI